VQAGGGTTIDLGIRVGLDKVLVRNFVEVARGYLEG
jgi:hypothetical protein